MLDACARIRDTCPQGQRCVATYRRRRLTHLRLVRTDGRSRRPPSATCRDAFAIRAHVSPTRSHGSRIPAPTSDMLSLAWTMRDDASVLRNNRATMGGPTTSVSAGVFVVPPRTSITSPPATLFSAFEATNRRSPSRERANRSPLRGSTTTIGWGRNGRRPSVSRITKSSWVKSANAFRMAVVTARSWPTPNAARRSPSSSLAEIEPTRPRG